MKTIHKKLYKKSYPIEEESKPPKAEIVKNHLKKHFSKYTQSTFIIPVTGISILFIAVILGFYLFVKLNQDFAANFADNTLRPLIGNQATIGLEAFFFNMEDRVNQFNYHAEHTPTTITYAQAHTIGATITTEQTPRFPLEQIPPLITSDPLQGEGEWTTIVSSDQAQLIAKTTYRPDTDRPYAQVSLVKMNTDLLKLGVVAGIQQPGGRLKPGPGRVPQDVQASNKLIAAFNGGFQQKDGYYGMIVGATTYLPLLQNLATFVIHENQPPVIVRYTGQNLGNDVLAIRQNGPLLVDNSQIVTSSNAWNMQTWGLTTTNSMYTWRSGVGVTKEGNLVYASGPSLIPETLAKALLAAGAVDAMQLDINPIWVRYILFDSVGSGQYSAHPLDPNMVNGGSQYLNGYQKDFFYVYKK